MPRADRTGPMGWGLMTGRGADYCAGFNVPGYMSRVLGRGFGGGGYAGRGGGRGWRHWFYATSLRGWLRFGGGLSAWGALPAPYTAPFPPEAAEGAEVRALKAQASSMEQHLASLRQRIQKLETETKTE